MQQPFANPPLTWLLALCTSLAASASPGPQDTQAGAVHPPALPPPIQLTPRALPPESSRIGQVVPVLTVLDMGAHERRLFEQRAPPGTIVVVRDPRCPVSLRHVPRLASLARQYQPLAYRFVFIYPTLGLEREQRLLDRARLGIPGIYVERGGFALAEHLGVRSTGDVFVLDASHRLRYRGAIDDQYGIGYTKGLPTRHYLRDAIEAVAAGEQVTISATFAPGCHVVPDPGAEWITSAPDDGQPSA